MEITNEILKKYFKIPKKIRFIAYYLISFFLYMYFVKPTFKVTLDGNNLDPIVGITNLSTVILEAAQEKRLFQVVVVLAYEWFMILLGFAFFSIPITILLFVERNVRITIMRDNNKYTTGENIEYYREILNNIPPGIVSIIDNFKIEPKKDMLAGVLKLFLTGHVKFENNKLKVVDKDINNIPISQQVLYKMIKDGKISNTESEEWKKVCSEEAIKKGFVVESVEDNKKQVLNFNIKGIIILFGGIFFFFGLELAAMELGLHDVLISYIMIAFFLFVAFYFPYLIGYNVYYSLRKSDYTYTEKGEKTRDRLKGLRRYIKEYSSLNEKDKLEVVLWDDYLIYAIIFEDNTKIIKDMLKTRGLNTNIDFDEFYFIKDNYKGC